MVSGWGWGSAGAWTALTSGSPAAAGGSSRRNSSSGRVIISGSSGRPHHTWRSRSSTGQLQGLRQPAAATFLSCPELLPCVPSHTAPRTPGTPLAHPWQAAP